jgi:hypothetical protein
MTTRPGWSRREVYKLENDLQWVSENRQICGWFGVAARQWLYKGTGVAAEQWV